jgi:hypothetical protein
MSDRPADGERGSKVLQRRDLLAHTDGPTVVEEGGHSVEGMAEAVKKPDVGPWFGFPSGLTRERPSAELGLALPAPAMTRS